MHLFSMVSRQKKKLCNSRKLRDLRLQLPAVFDADQPLNTRYYLLLNQTNALHGCGVVPAYVRAAVALANSETLSTCTTFTAYLHLNTFSYSPPGGQLPPRPNPALMPPTTPKTDQEDRSGWCCHCRRCAKPACGFLDSPYVSHPLSRRNLVQVPIFSLLAWLIFQLSVYEG